MRTRNLLTLLALLLAMLMASASAATPSSAGPWAGGPAFLPVIFSSSIDFSISQVEISQAIQRVDNSVPLVSGRPTIMRVFAVTSAGVSPGNVTVSLSASRNGVALGTVYSSPAAVPQTPTRASYSSTFNFALPGSWLTGNVVLTATVDAAGVVAESDENNNTHQTAVSFNSVPALNVRIVPVSYTHQGSISPGLYPAQEDDRLKSWIMRAFPLRAVTTSFRTPYLDFQGNLDNVSDWSELLYDVTDLKLFDGAPSSQIYYGLIPIRSGNRQWFHSGVAGIGWIGARSAVGLNLPSLNGTGTLAGHEIGHNMGRRHAPCGVSGSDTAYPYPDAWIGEYGLDINGSIVSLYGPNSYKDMMSYCSPEWISDYTYTALYNDQRAKGLLAPEVAAPALLVRARLNEAGGAIIEPVYSLMHVPVEPPSYSDYRLSLLDESGSVLASRPAAVLVAEEPSLRARALYASFPVPDARVAAIRLEEKGELLEQRLLAPARDTASASITTSSASTLLSWNQKQTAALIRFTSDGGATWTTLGFDVLGGEMMLDRQALPGKRGRIEIVLADEIEQNATAIPFDFSD